MLTLRHVTIVVPDLDEAAAWYRELFGFRPIVDYYRLLPGGGIFDLDDDKPVSLRARVLNAGGALLILEEFESPKSAFRRRRVWDSGIGHIGLFAPELHAQYDRLKQCGMTFYSTPNLIDSGELRGRTWVYGEDLYGNVIELCHYTQLQRPRRRRAAVDFPHSPPLPLASPDMPLWLDHVGIVAPLFQMSRYFYSDSWAFPVLWRERRTKVNDIAIGLPGESVYLYGTMLAAGAVGLEIHKYNRPPAPVERIRSDLGLAEIGFSTPVIAADNARLTYSPAVYLDSPATPRTPIPLRTKERARHFLDPGGVHIAIHDEPDGQPPSRPVLLP